MKFNLISFKSFVIHRARVRVFYGGVSAACHDGSEMIEWLAKGDKEKALRRAGARSQARIHERRTNSLGVVIITVLLFILVAAALTAGGNVFISRHLQSTSAERKAMETGDIVVAMPDGVYCRHLVFDNRSGKVSGAKIEQCSSAADIGSDSSGSRFRWGRR
jgi:uncharacterized membrane protein YgcG